MLNVIRCRIWGMLVILFGTQFEAYAEPAVREQPNTVLADYLAREDASYGWKLLRTGKIGAVEFADVLLTSKIWQGIEWKHRLIILKPVVCEHASHGLMLISGGNWDEKFTSSPPDSDLPGEAIYLARVAERISSPVVILQHVPFQPMFDGEVEDELIAHIFDSYLNTLDTSWPLLMPMVKSSFRAFDSTQEVCRKEWSIDVISFTVTGGSKRGCTTWLLAAVDPRVSAIGDRFAQYGTAHHPSTRHMGRILRRDSRLFGTWPPVADEYSRKQKSASHSRPFYLSEESASSQTDDQWH